MRTLYKKVIIIGASALVLEIIVVYFLYTSINAFYSDLNLRLANLLVEQVRNVIAAEKIDFSSLSQYNKYPLRRVMSRLSGNESKITHILLIDSTKTILVSDDPSVEGKQYTTPEELEYFNTDKPTITNREWAGSQEIIDVIYPIIQDSVKQGYLRTVISVENLENFYQNRNLVLLFASIVTVGILILTVIFTSRIYQTNLKDIQTAIDKLHQSDYEYRVEYGRRDEFTPIFSRLNELFEKTLDLNESFKQSEDRIKAMMRVIHEGLMIMDPEMKIVSYNEYLLELLHIRNHMKPEDQIYRLIRNNPQLLDIFRRAQDPMTHAVRKTLTLRLLDKRTIDVQINALSILDGQDANSIIFYIKNIAVLQELEQNLHRSMKYTVISQLASSIGHEIRNPLSSLAIHTEILDNLADGLPVDENGQEKFKKSINILNSEIERLAKLIDQFFNLAKPREIDLSFEDINSVISEVVDLVQQEAYEKNVNLVQKLGKNLPLVNISHDQIKQVIINIVLNAYDAMPEGGELQLITRGKDDHVQIVVKDTGVGIPEEIEEQIFELYFSTKSTGGGIGLAISKKIIEAHEGKIYFISKQNEGTSFIIELPRA